MCMYFIAEHFSTLNSIKKINFEWQEPSCLEVVS